MVNQESLGKFASYARRYEEEKKIRVYYIPMVDRDTQEHSYFYVVASALLHDKFMEAMDYGVVPDFAVVVEEGEGHPTDAVKDKMKRYYNFDHDAYFAAQKQSGAPTGNAAL